MLYVYTGRTASLMNKNMKKISSKNNGFKISRIDIIGQSGNDYPPTDFPSRMKSKCHEGHLMNDFSQGSPDNEQRQKYQTLQAL